MKRNRVSVVVGTCLRSFVRSFDPALLVESWWIAEGGREAVVESWRWDANKRFCWVCGEWAVHSLTHSLTLFVPAVKKDVAQPGSYFFFFLRLLGSHKENKSLNPINNPGN